MERYVIGDIAITWDGGGYQLLPGEFMPMFRHDGPWDGETIHFRGVFEPMTPYRDYPLLLEQELFSVYDVHGERLLLYHWSYLRDAYGIWLDRIGKNDRPTCSLDPAMKTQIPMSADWFFGVCGMQKAFLARQRTVLHASFVDWNGQAILFTAPSGTGKSTQAELWRRCFGCRVLNGDRVLLGKRDVKWYAYGYPNCGSSQICIPENLPLRAIVVLEQGPENRVVAMTAAQKLRALASGMAIYRWDSDDIRRAAMLAGQLLESVCVVKLVCRPDEDAARTLKNYLEGEGRCLL